MLSTYHAKFYLKIRTGSHVIFTLFLGFGRPPLLDSKMTGRIKNVFKKVDRPTRLPCAWSGFCCLCHNVALLSTYLNGRLF